MDCMGEDFPIEREEFLDSCSSLSLYMVLEETSKAVTNVLAND